MQVSSLFFDVNAALADAPSLLRVAIFFVTWFFLWLPIAIPLSIALKWQPPNPVTPAQKLPLLASLYILVPLILWGITHLETSSFAAYGLPFQVSVLRSISIGFVVGVIGLALLFAIELAFGWLRWQFPTGEEASKARTSLLSTASLTLAIGIWISLTEELVFRGFLLNQLQRDFSPWIAAAIASLIFAVLHLIWEGRDNIPQLPGLWLMGMVLVLARWVDGGELGLAIGLHAGWIWAIATIDTEGLIKYSDRVPAWVTGLDGKPLAGIMGILFLLATAVVLWQS